MTWLKYRYHFIQLPTVNIIEVFAMIKFLITNAKEEIGMAAFAYGLIAVLIVLAAIASVVSMGGG